MSTKIKLQTRGDNNYLVNMLNSDGTESKTYKLVTEYSHVRCGYTEKNTIDFVDPSSGPFMRVGSTIEGVGKIKEINPVKDVGFLITFE